jgi:hypothetical protein
LQSRIIGWNECDQFVTFLVVYNAADNAVNDNPKKCTRQGLSLDGSAIVGDGSTGNHPQDFFPPFFVQVQLVSLGSSDAAMVAEYFRGLGCALSLALDCHVACSS